MPIGWEAVTALSTAVTTVILLMTVLLGRRQLELLRRSTQLDGLIAVLRQLHEPRYIESYQFVINELERKMNDPEFRADFERGGLDESVHKELATLQIYEQLGAFVHFGLVDPETIYCQAGPRAVRCWEKLKDVVAIQRGIGGPGVWDNYERLYHGTVRFARRTNPNYPGPFSASAKTSRPLETDARTAAAES